MKVVPIASPAVQQPGNATATPPAPMSVRDRAVAAWEKQAASQAATAQPEQAIVKNATRVSPEEMTAVKAPSRPANQGQEYTSEAPASDATAAPVTPEAPISSQYAVLARKEKALRAKAAQQEQALRTKEAAFKAQEEAFKAREAEYQSKYLSKDKFTSNPLQALQDAGLSYEEITNMILNQPNPEQAARDSQLNALNAKIKSLEESQERANKSYEERELNNRKQAVSQIKNDVLSLVRSDPSFETIKETNSVDDVVSLIERTFDEDGVLLTVQEAAEAVENEVAEQLYRYTSRIAKVRNRLQPGKNSAQPAQKQGTPSSNNQLKTLTNSVGSSRQLSARERAILAFKGELKNS